MAFRRPDREPPPMSESRPSLPTVAALIAAAASVAGSLYLSLGMGLIACPLCFYQRTFAFAILGILILGVCTGARQTGYVNLFAFLPTIAGGLIAAFHTYLEVSGKLVCPKGIAGIGSTAQQSLASFILILACLLPGLGLDVRRKGLSVASVGWSMLLAGAFAYGCIVSAPASRMPPADMRPFICHPPVTPD
jgi:disulfide bond formation protein DsbB